MKINTSKRKKVLHYGNQLYWLSPGGAANEASPLCNWTYLFKKEGCGAEWCPWQPINCLCVWTYLCACMLLFLIFPHTYSLFFSLPMFLSLHVCRCFLCMLTWTTLLEMHDGFEPKQTYTFITSPETDIAFRLEYIWSRFSFSLYIYIQMYH